MSEVSTLQQSGIDGNSELPNVVDTVESKKFQIFQSEVNALNSQVDNLISLATNSMRTGEKEKIYQDLKAADILCFALQAKITDARDEVNENDRISRQQNVKLNIDLAQIGRKLDLIRQQFSKSTEPVRDEDLSEYTKARRQQAPNDEVNEETIAGIGAGEIDNTLGADGTIITRTVRGDSDLEMLGDSRKLTTMVDNSVNFGTQPEASTSAAETENPIHSYLQPFMDQLKESPHFGQFFQQEVLKDAEVRTEFVSNINETITQLLSKDDRPDEVSFDQAAVWLWMDAVDAVLDWAEKNAEATQSLDQSVQNNILMMRNMEIYDFLAEQIAKTKVDLMAAWDRHHANEAKVPTEKTLAEKAQEAINNFNQEFDIGNIRTALAERGVDTPEKLLDFMEVSMAIRDVETARDNLQEDIDDEENLEKPLRRFEKKVAALRDLINRYDLSNSGSVENPTAKTAGGRIENENNEPSKDLFTAEWVRGYDLIKPAEQDNEEAATNADKFSKELAAELNDLLNQEIDDALENKLYKTDNTLNDDINDRIVVLAGAYQSKDGLDFSKIDDPDKGEDSKSRNDFVKEVARMINEAVEEAQKKKNAETETDSAVDPTNDNEPATVIASENNEATKGWRKILDRFKNKKQESVPKNENNRQYLENAKTAIEKSSLWQNKKRWLLRLLAAGVGAVATHALREVNPNIPLTPARIATLLLGGSAAIVYLRGHEAKMAQTNIENGNTRRAKLHRLLHGALDRFLVNADLLSAASFGSSAELFFHQHNVNQQTETTETQPPSTNGPTTQVEDGQRLPDDHGTTGRDYTNPLDTSGDSGEYDKLKHPVPHLATLVDQNGPVDTSGDMTELGDLHHPADQARETFNFHHQSIWDNLRETAKDIDGVQANADYPHQVTNPGEVAAGQVIDPAKDAILGFNTHLTPDQINHPNGMAAMTLEGVTSVEQIHQLQVEHPDTLLMPSESQQRRFMEFAAEALKADNLDAHQQLVRDLNGTINGNPLLANEITPEQKTMILDIFNGVV